MLAEMGSGIEGSGKEGEARDMPEVYKWIMQERQQGSRVAPADASACGAPVEVRRRCVAGGEMQGEENAQSQLHLRWRTCLGSPDSSLSSAPSPPPSPAQSSVNSSSTNRCHSVALGQHEDEEEGKSRTRRTLLVTTPSRLDRTRPHIVTSPSRHKHEQPAPPQLLRVPQNTPATGTIGDLLKIPSPLLAEQHTNGNMNK